MRTLSTSLSLALIAFTVSSIFIPSGSGISIQSFDMHMVGENPLRDSQGRYRMVAGIWHRVDIYLDVNADAVEMEMQYGDFTEKNTMNHYRWLYSDGNWSDAEYGIYMEPDRCDRTGTLYSFFVGVDGKVNYGVWNLTVRADGEEIYSSEIYVEKATVGADFHSADFVLWTEPFTAETIDSADNMQYLRIVNGGNTPLYYNITFSAFSDRINITGKADVVHVGGEAIQYIRFRTDEWSPRVIEIKGRINAGALYRIPTASTATLITGVGTTFPIAVYVGHSGYEILEKDGLTIQIKRRMSVDYGAESELKIFLTGNGTATLDIRGDNCTIEEIVYNGERRNTPFTVLLSREFETNITVRIKADVPDVVARVIYSVEYEGNKSTYSTDVEVGSAPPPEPVPPSAPDKTLAVAFIIGAAALATAYILLTHKKAADEVKNRGKKDVSGKKSGRKRRGRGDR